MGLARQTPRSARVNASHGPGATLLKIGLGLVALLWLLPYVWMLSTSFKTLPEIVAAPTAPLPSGLDFSAYRAVFSAMPLGRYFWNTTVMALAIAAIQIAVALPAGYALAKLDFTGRALAFGLVVATLLIPAQVRFVPVFVLSPSPAREHEPPWFLPFASALSAPF